MGKGVLLTITYTRTQSHRCRNGRLGAGNRGKRVAMRIYDLGLGVHLYCLSRTRLVTFSRTRRRYGVEDTSTDNIVHRESSYKCLEKNEFTDY